MSINALIRTSHDIGMAEKATLEVAISCEEVGADR